MKPILAAVHGLVDVVTNVGALWHWSGFHCLLWALEVARRRRRGDGGEALEVPFELFFEAFDALSAIILAVALLFVLALRTVGITVSSLAACPALAFGNRYWWMWAFETLMFSAAIGTFSRASSIPPMGRCGVSLRREAPPARRFCRRSAWPDVGHHH